MMWVGKDKFGVYKGFKTLFIATREVTYKQINKYIEEFRLHQVYFGVLNSDINFEVIDRCIKELKNITITVEVDISKLDKVPTSFFAKNLQFMITNNNKNYSLLRDIDKTKIQVKLQNVIGDDFVLVNDYLSFNKNEEQRKQTYGYKGDLILDE